MAIKQQKLFCPVKCYCPLFTYEMFKAYCHETDVKNGHQIATTGSQKQLRHRKLEGDGVAGTATLGEISR